MALPDSARRLTFGVEESGEQRTALLTAVAAPGSEGLDGIGLGVVAVRDADNGAFGVLVGLGGA